MTQPIRRTLPPVSGFASTEVASFIAQLDDQARRLTEDTRGLTREALSWQPAPGMNTIGMLLAHNALVEVFWTSHMMEIPFECRQVLGIDEQDEGMPLPEDGKPPAALAGKDLAFFDDLLAKARTFIKQHAARLRDSDLDAVIVRKRPDGTEVHIEKRWILYHLLEHYAGHYGQINLLRHLHRNSTAKV